MIVHDFTEELFSPYRVPGNDGTLLMYMWQVIAHTVKTIRLLNALAFNLITSL